MPGRLVVAALGGLLLFLARLAGVADLAVAVLAGLAVAFAPSCIPWSPIGSAAGGVRESARAGRARLLAGLATALALALCGHWLWPRLAERALPLLPALGLLAASLHFASTLRPGREALIIRYIRLDHGRVPPECVAYARGLTGFWAAVLLALAAFQGASLPASAGTAGPVPAFTPVLLAGLFLGEHLVRRRRFPHLAASPRRTLGAVWRFHAGQGRAAPGALPHAG
ncbi:hypothetical protein M0638_10540 [Roseomonas sp. NAR14]|uniref:Uncharacterized protein n=1 Tax=Roseomonas acroporae TaxID=2937791 RepID=A0A9X1Y9H3_9PROT|nr:hypothetical protein [Roseomonas acroporae]MCK8784820.1 hypothetical protein [Roseomonas acroporae]